MGEREDDKNQTCNELPYHERRRKMDKDEHGLETRTPEVRRVGVRRKCWDLRVLKC